MQDNKLFEDKAWEEMKLLLDQEMPERKPILFWKRWYVLLPLFFFISAGIYIASTTDFNQDDSKEEMPSSVSNYVAVNTPTDKQENVDDSRENGALAQSTFTEYTSGTESLKNAKTHNTPYNTNNSLSTNKTNLPKAKSNTIIASSNNTIENQFIPSSSSNDAISNPILIDANQKTEISLNQQKSDIKNKKYENALDNSLKEESSSEFALVSSELLELKGLDFLEFENDINYPLPKINKLTNWKHTFGVFARLNYLPDYRSFSQVVGFNYELKNRKSSVSLRSGLNYEKLSFNSLNKGSRPVFADLEENGPFTNSGNEIGVQLENASQLNIPVLINFNKNKFSFGLGINNAFLINEVLAERTSNLSSSNFNTSYRFSFVKELNYHITNSLSTGLNFRYDISEFNNGNTTSNKKPHAVGLSLYYRIK